jgi:AcrR family transcriptional regulator
MRKVANALNTGAASLYAHIQDLDELLSLVLDSALTGVRIPRAREQWDKALEQIVLSYLRVLFRHAGVARLAISAIATGPNSLRIMEAILQLLEQAGCSGEDAAWGTDLILHFAASTAAEQTARRTNLLKEISKTLEEIDAAIYPRVYALRHDFLSGGIDRFLWGLRAIVEGILGESGKVRKGLTSVRHR